MRDNRPKWFGGIMKKDKLKEITVVIQINIKRKGLRKRKKKQ